jgi:hypothetical protein
VAGEAVPGRQLHRRDPLLGPYRGTRSGPLRAGGGQLDRRAEQGPGGLAEPRGPPAHDPPHLPGEAGQLPGPEGGVQHDGERRDAADLGQALLQGGVAGGGQEQPGGDGDGGEDEGGAGDRQRHTGEVDQPERRLEQSYSTFSKPIRPLSWPIVPGSDVAVEDAVGDLLEGDPHR